MKKKRERGNEEKRKAKKEREAMKVRELEEGAS